MTTPTRFRILLAALLLALAGLGCGNLSPDSQMLDDIQQTMQEATR